MGTLRQSRVKHPCSLPSNHLSLRVDHSVSDLQRACTGYFAALIHFYVLFINLRLAIVVEFDLRPRSAYRVLFLNNSILGFEGLSFSKVLKYVFIYLHTSESKRHTVFSIDRVVAHQARVEEVNYDHDQ